MEKIQSQVREFMLRAGQACPDQPTIPDTTTRILRARLLLEECLEFCKASGVSTYVIINGQIVNVDIETLVFKDSGMWNPPDLVEVADALADTNYVSYGAALAYGIDLAPIEDHVHASNLSKFIDGWTDEFGKFRKGPSYKPVDLKPLLEEQYAK